VVVPDGIMFQSPKGIYLLNRALQVEYIGWPTEGVMTTVQLNGGVMDPSNRQIVWGLAAAVTFGPVIVTQIAYDYFTQQWVTNGYGGTATIRDLCVWQSVITALTGAGVSKQTAAQFYEQITSTPIQMYVRTGWIKLSGLQGFQRAWRLLVLGSTSHHTRSPWPLPTTIRRPRHRRTRS
jgi:hypothetical protein